MSAVLTVTDNRETELLASVPDGLFIGGQWRPASADKTLKVYAPATGQVVKVIADALPEDGASETAHCCSRSSPSCPY